jgi:Ca2+-binding EF-hand superfamily protein
VVDGGSKKSINFEQFSALMAGALSRRSVVHEILATFNFLAKTDAKISMPQLRQVFLSNFYFPARLISMKSLPA